MQTFVNDLPGKKGKRIIRWNLRQCFTGNLSPYTPLLTATEGAARLLMNLALLQAGYPVAIVPPILRREYLDTLNKTHKSDNRPFINFIAGVCYESVKEYLRLLEG